MNNNITLPFLTFFSLVTSKFKMSGKEPTKNEGGSITLCCVDGCGNGKKFGFPEDPLLKKQWLQAIRKENFTPNRQTDGLCAQHFRDSDFTDSTPHTVPEQCTTLRSDAVPSIFPWSDCTTKNVDLHEKSIIVSQSETSQVRECLQDVQEGGSNSNTSQINDNEHADAFCVVQEEPMLVDEPLTSHSGSDNSSNCQPNTKMYHGDPSTKMPVGGEILKDDQISDVKSDKCNPDLSLDEEVIEPDCNNTSDGRDSSKESSENISYPQNDESVLLLEGDDSCCDEKPKPDHDIEKYKRMPEAILHLTGLEDYDRFRLVLQSIGPAVYHMEYLKGPVESISVPNQLFLVLRKLRLNESDSSLAAQFNIDKIAIGNIFMTWIICMYQHWSLLDLWPNRDLVDFYMPTSFQDSYPSLKVIIDTFEIPIERPTNQKSQQSSSSKDENESTMKVLFGFTPLGLIAYHSAIFNGSASNSEILEKCDLLKKCEPGDSIMVDEGFFGQDNRVTNGVSRHGLTLIEGYPPHAKIMRDQQLSKLNTFEILKSKLDRDYVPLVLEIFKACVMLCNFKDTTMVD